jgi:hypothetical protein
MFRQRDVSISSEDHASMKFIDGQSPITLSFQRASRQMLEHILKNEFPFRLSKQSRRAIEDVLTYRASARAPITPSPDAMRVGWADEADELEAKDDWEGFVAGESYSVRSFPFETVWFEERDHPEYGKEKVECRSNETMIAVLNRYRQWCGFPSNPAQNSTDPKMASIRRLYPISDLRNHFHLPHVTSLTEMLNDQHAELMLKVKNAFLPAKKSPLPKKRA